MNDSYSSIYFGQRNLECNRIISDEVPWSLDVHSEATSR